MSELRGIVYPIKRRDREQGLAGCHKKGMDRRDTMFTFNMERTREQIRLEL